MTRLHLIVAGTVLAAHTACSTEDPATGWAGTITDSAGVELVSNPETGSWTHGEAWTVVEDLRIGSLAGDPDYQFGQVGSIVVSSVGEIFVSDRQALEVRVFSPEGTLLRTIGAPGSGPGQFGRGPLELLMSQDDVLLVPDVANRRLHRFSSDGKLAGSAAIDLERGRPLRFRWNSTTGAMAVQLRPVSLPAPAEPGLADEIRSVEASGEFGATLLEVPSGGLFEEGGLRYFTPEPWWDVTDSLTVLYAVNSEYRIRTYSVDGSLRRVLSKAARPRPITDRDIRALFVYLDQAWLDAGVSPARLPANRERISFAEFFPAFSTFHTGPAGSLWVQPVQSPADLSDDDIERYNFVEDFGGPAWDVFDSDGRFLGVVEMPPRFQPRMFQDDMIYGVWRDEFDVQYVVRLRIVGGTGPSP